MYSVYIHKNKINNKVYVGLTKQKPEARWRLNGQGYKNQPKFWRAIESYGWENFEHIIYKDNLTENEASILEQNLIKEFNSVADGYNVDLGGTLTNHSEETIEKIRNAMIGKTHTEETKQKISSSKKECKKPVICLETGIEYDGAGDAMRATGIDRASIGKVCKGKMNSAGGYHWYFKGEEPVIRKNKSLRPVICLNTGKIYPSIAAAAKDTNSDASNIKKVCDGKYKTTNGLKWKYEDEEI